MKSISKLCLLSITALGAVLPSLPAADTTPPPAASAAPTTTPKERHANRAERRSELKRLIEELNLTPDQQAKIKELLKARRSAIQALPQAERKGEKAKAIRESSRSQIRAVLTPEQQAKFDAMKEGHGPGKHGHHDDQE